MVLSVISVALLVHCLIQISWGASLLIGAGVIPGRTLTSNTSVRTDLLNTKACLLLPQARPEMAGSGGAFVAKYCCALRAKAIDLLNGYSVQVRG